MRHVDAAAFLDRAEAWLLQREAEHNLHLSLSYARRGGSTERDPLYATVEREGVVEGCVMRTPPHKLLVTDMPLSAASLVARAAADIYETIPAVLGPPEVATRVAEAWIELKGGACHRGMEQGLYRLEQVVPAEPVPGSMRPVEPADLERIIPWGAAFGHELGAAFALGEDAVHRMMERGDLHVWDDGEPVSMAVAQGVTPNGCRVGFVFTPPELRGHGYASALVAALSQKMLDSGLSFCVLYTDLSNPTSNSIYRRIGYQQIAEVWDVDIDPGA